MNLIFDMDAQNEEDADDDKARQRQGKHNAGKGADDAGAINARCLHQFIWNICKIISENQGGDRKSVQDVGGDGRTGTGSRMAKPLSRAARKNYSQLFCLKVEILLLPPALGEGCDCL